MAKVSLRAYNREIEAMIDRGHLDEAIAHCQHILKTYPKHLETYRLLGKSYLEAKRYSEAVDIFSRVLAAEPSDFVSQVGMSIIRDEQDKFDDAIWHMERAFETQPSNAAIQGELQRLYGRRDGVQPPRIRMTRGALAHMYMQGELYPQAISETKSVLEEDKGRSDMQALLAKAYFKSGQKNDAADAASAVLRRYPYCLDANRVLAEILGSDRPESAEVYRRRVFELDPYAAQVDGSIFQSDNVSDAAVTIEQLDWNGQPTGMASDWSSTQAIGLGSGSSDEQPDWLKNGFSEEASTPPSIPVFASEEDTSSTPESSAPAQPADDIPDFLRAAGWGESSGAFDESKASSMFDDEPVADAQPIEQGDMPDWVRAMAPKEEETSEAEPAEAAEEIPDWINKIGTAELPVPGAEGSIEDQPDWLSQAADEIPATEAPLPVADQSDFPSQSEDETEASSSLESMDENADFLTALENIQPEDSEQATTLSEERSTMPDENGNLGMGEDEQDDSFAWLENLAAKQGATEGLLTNPEERLEEEPDWVKQAKELATADEVQPSTQDEQPEPETPAESETPAPEPSAGLDDLGRSDEERDDSFAWLENLAAKQGATEGLLTEPEERLEEEPDWVKQAKDSGGLAQPSEAVAEEMPEPVPSSTTDTGELGKSDEERDDSFAWLENLAAKQGATEGLLTKPEERLEDEPDWVKQAKSVGESPEVEPTASVEQPEFGEPEQDMIDHAREVGEKIFDESMSVSEEETETPAEPEAPAEDNLAWLGNLEEEEEPKQEVYDPALDTKAWLQALDKPEEKAAETESTGPVEEAAESSGGLPDWLNDLDSEESEAPVATLSGDDDLPAWMRDETGESVAEPTRIEPTRPTDWAPEEEKEVEAEEVSPPVPTLASEPVSDSKPEPAVELAPTPEPEVESEPEPAVEPTLTPEPEIEAEPEPAVEPAPVQTSVEKKPEPKAEEVKPASPPQPYKEPVTRKATGMLEMPIDPILESARTELSRSNIPGALETYGKLIKKGRFLEEVIHDLRDALYRYPVEVSIWQSLGDAYMRANQLQDALDAYTKAEELLR